MLFRADDVDDSIELLLLLLHVVSYYLAPRKKKTIETRTDSRSDSLDWNNSPFSSVYYSHSHSSTHAFVPLTVGKKG